MKQRDIDDTTANRDAADGGVMPRPRDDHNLFEKARDTMAGTANRTRDDVDDARRTATNEDAASYDAERTDAAHTDVLANDDDADYTKNRRDDADRRMPGKGSRPIADDIAESTTGAVAPRDATGADVAGARTALDATAGGTGTASVVPNVTDDTGKSLLPSDSLSGFQSRWQQIQIGFVDEPQTAVRDAETLVNDVVTQLTKLFTQERENLEQNWNRGTEVSTEDLRVALQRYRSFFQRLLAA